MDIAELRTRTVETLSQLREQHLSTLRPANDFFDLNRVSRPADMVSAQTRLTANSKYYMTNYILIVAILALYALITNVLLLFALILLIGGLGAIRMYVTEPFEFNGVTITPKALYTTALVIGIPILWLSSPFSTFVWIVGASAVLILLHALMLDPPYELQYGQTIEPV